MTISPSSFSTEIDAQSEEDEVRDIGGMPSETTGIVGIKSSSIGNSILVIGSFSTELHNGSSEQLKLSDMERAAGKGKSLEKLSIRGRTV